ncbi:MAG: 2-amino-4-hydroxy-6-hydroxymethyldihydropteridine diphosphokinase [Clostridiales bacterium]|nr:2-amino-4-hydroxy-6-hydroxymethyldihydropteridine diphosphokinase [Clostridiales bacterium]
MSKAVIGLGSNLGDSPTNLKAAVKAVSLLPGTQVVGLSKIYETVPVGEVIQPDFFNAAILIETRLTPRALLGACLGIEAAMGRLRTVKDGPRTIDLDLLLFENIRDESFELTLPHPGILKRAFVLVPLGDLFPAGRALGLYFAPALRDIDKSGVRETLFTLNDY